MCSQVNARPGENMGDAARRAGLAVPYGCKQGVCGTCEATQRQPTGQNNLIKVCSTKVAASNLDAPDREKMWGDLRWEFIIAKHHSRTTTAAAATTTATATAATTALWLLGKSSGRLPAHYILSFVTS